MEATILLWISSLWLSTCTNLSNAHYVVINNPTGFVDLIRAHQFIEVFKIILRAAKRERNGHLIRFMWEKCKVRNSFAMAFNGSIKGSVSFRLFHRNVEKIKSMLQFVKKYENDLMMIISDIDGIDNDIAHFLV